MNKSLSKFVPLALCAVTLSLGATIANAQGTAQGPSINPAYVAAVNNALPQGKTIETATKAELLAAINAALSANPQIASNPQAILDIIRAVASRASLTQLPMIAEAVGQLFASNPALANLAPDISSILATAAASKGGSLDAQATAVGVSASTLASFLDPKNPANHEAIIGIIVKAVEVNQQLDYTATVYSIFNRSLQDIGAPQDLILAIETGVLNVVPDAQIREQIAAKVAKDTTQHLNPPSGPVTITETPKTNS